jgi:hypothetical protein
VPNRFLALRLGIHCPAPSPAAFACRTWRAPNARSAWDENDDSARAAPTAPCPAPQILEAMWDDATALVLTPQAFSNIHPGGDIFNNINQQVGRRPRGPGPRPRPPFGPPALQNAPPPKRCGESPWEHRRRRRQTPLRPPKNLPPAVLGVHPPRHGRVGLRGLHGDQLLPARARTGHGRVVP